MSETTAVRSPAPATSEFGRPTARAAFVGMMIRDARVLRRNIGEFLGRTLIQPFLFVFVFTYVFPKIGQGFTGSSGESFATILVPGLVAVAIVFTGIMAVGLPLSIEFGATKEIEDRLMAPLPVWAVAIEKVVFAAGQSLLAGLCVFPLVYFIPATNVSVHVSNWALLVIVMALACILSGSLGLVLGCVVRPEKIGLMFAIVVVPLTFLGCVYYPWAQLAPVRWLQVVVLINPLVYLCEGLRAALTPELPHMATWAFLGAAVLSCALLLVAGVRLFVRRVIT
ncbi:MAG TPA: ABC transporter permease [Actinomycetota bacterium]